MRSNKYLAMVILAAALAGCSEGIIENTPDSIVTSSNHAMINGEKETSSARAAVVALYNSKSSATCGGEGIFCTGTLIHPQWVLTAAHCVAEESSNSTWYQTSYELSSCNNKMKIGVGNTETTVSKRLYDVSSVYFHKSYGDRMLNQYYGTLDGDIALIKLKKPIPSTIAKPILPLPEWLGIHSEEMPLPMEFVGFGYNEKAKIGTKLKFAANVSDYCGAADKNDSTTGCRKDAVLVNGCHPAYTDQCYYNAREYVLMPYGGIYYEQDDGGPCQGDSGGPAFVTRNGQEYVAGITSYGDGACVAYGISTAVQDYHDWIRSIAPEVETQYTEICDDQIDNNGNGKIDCEDEACANDAACKVVAPTPTTPDDDATTTPTTPDDDATTTPTTPDDDATTTPTTPDDDATTTPTTPDDDATTTPTTPDDDATTTPTTPDDEPTEPAAPSETEPSSDVRLETFTGIGNDSNSYKDFTWISPNTTIQWKITKGRTLLTEGNVDYSIDGEGLILKDSSSIEGSVFNLQSVSVQVRKAMPNTKARSISISVNGNECASADISVTDDVSTLSCDQLTIDGKADIKIATKISQVTIDNIKITQ